MKRTSILEESIARAGIVKGARATEVVVSWALARDALGHELGDGELSPAVREHAAYWHQSERTSWRELERFREVWPEESSPARLAGLVLAASEDRSEARLASAPLSLDAAA